MCAILFFSWVLTLFYKICVYTSMTWFIKPWGYTSCYAAHHNLFLIAQKHKDDFNTNILLNSLETIMLISPLHREEERMIYFARVLKRYCICIMTKSNKVQIYYNHKNIHFYQISKFSARLKKGCVWVLWDFIMILI